MSIQIKNIPVLLILLSVILVFPPDTNAQDNAGEDLLQVTGILTLDECLDIAIENNIGLRQARIGLDLSLLDRIRSESIFDPGFQLELNTQQSEGGDVTGNDRYNFGASYTDPTWSGGTWALSFDQTRSDGTMLIEEISTGYTSYTSQIGLSYSMPLLEGSGERINRLGIDRSNLSIRRSEASLSDAERQLRYSVIQAYMQAVLARRQITVAELSLETTNNLVEEVQAFIDVGQLAPYELLAAQAGLAERRESLLNAETAYNLALDNLKEILGLQLREEIEVDTGILHPVYGEYDIDELYYVAQTRRPDIEDLDLRIQQAQLDLMLVTDQLDPSLDWTTILGLAGEDDDYTGSIGNMDNFTWYTGLQYRVPLGGNRAAEVDVASTELALDQLELDRINTLRNLLQDLRSAGEGLTNALLRIDVTAQGLEVQEVKMESELARYELGLITSRDLLEFDLELASARLSYDSALADAILALATLEYLSYQPILSDALVLGEID